MHVERAELEIEIDSFGLTGDVVKRLRSELFFVYLVLSVPNQPI